jgi:peptidoglycan hydrolase CwlO-like protein
VRGSSNNEMSVKKKWYNHLNFNTVLIAVMGTAATWLTTCSLDSVKNAWTQTQTTVSETKKAVTETQLSVGKVETAIPYINENVKNLQSDLNGNHADLKAGQQQVWQAIREVRDEQTKFKEDLGAIKVRKRP